MRYELSDEEWIAIKPILPNKPRGVPRVNDRRVLDWHLLGLTIRGAMARPTDQLRSVHDLLQSLRSLRSTRCALLLQQSSSSAAICKRIWIGSPQEIER